MPLITDEHRAQLLANGTAANREEHDPDPVVRLFTVNAQATWLLTELDPADPDLAFGLCDLGLGHAEIGYVRLSEIEMVADALEIEVRPDANFVANKPLSAYAKDAQR